MHFPKFRIRSLTSRTLLVPVFAAALMQGLAAQDAPPMQNPPAAHAPAEQPGNQPAPNANARRGRGAGARGPAPQVVSARDEQPWTPSGFENLNPQLPTLFIAGDSTADKGPDAWHRGWAAVLGDYFDTSKINVVNRARGGRSFRSFVREGLWDQLVAKIKPGDYVVIQFGHNDGGDVNAANGRPDLPGVGDETRDITRMDGTVEKVLTFGGYARKYIKDVRDKGGIPLVMSTTARNSWADGKFRMQGGNMYRWAKEVADAEKVQWVDHQAAISTRYSQLGKEVVDTYFPADATHTSTPGAVVNAEQFVAAVRGLDNHPLAGYLNETGKKITEWKAAPPTAN